MGLDMFLYIEKYDSRFRSSKKDLDAFRKEFYPPEMEELAKSIHEECMSKTVRYEVAYWRKANAIHKWFVENPGEGVDECQMIYVSEDKLETLIMLCSEVLLDHARAEELLPTEDGFFFGSTTYDEWYFHDLENTVKMLEPVLKFVKEHSGYEIYYQASW